MKTMFRAAALLAPVLLVAGAVAPPNGSIVLAPSGTLFVVNPDSGSVSAINSQTRQKIAETAVGKDPRVLALSPDSRFLYVTNQGSATMSILDADTLRVSVSVKVDAEPYGVAASPAGDFVYVAASAVGFVDVVALGDAPQVVAWIPVGPRPKGLALSPDGSRLYVTHYFSGEVSVIDTASRQVLQVVSTGQDSNAAQRIVLSTVNGRAYVPHIRSNVANPYLLLDDTVFPVLSAIDLATNQHVIPEGADLSIGAHSVNLPSDIALSPNGKTAYVVNLGSGELSVVDLHARYRVADVDVGEGPRGLALSPDGSLAYVHNSLSDDVSVVDLGSLQETGRIQVTASPLDATVKRGKTLFFTSRPATLSRQRWMSCASCHLEGDMDGRTWQLAGIGPRNTQALRTAIASAPLHWDADSCTIHDVGESTIRDLMGGSGLIQGMPDRACTGPSNAGRSADLDALAAFVKTLSSKKYPAALDPAAVARGQAIFQRADVGCAVCHIAPLYTDSSLTSKPFLKHNVGTGDGPGEMLGAAFPTPPLSMLWDTAPYLHDGSAATLMDVLTTRNPLDLHGRTSMLSVTEKNDLIAFLLSL